MKTTAKRLKPVEKHRTAIDSNTIGDSSPEGLGFDGVVESDDGKSGLLSEGECVSPTDPPTPSSLPGISGVNEGRGVIIGAAREEESREDEMMSYLNRSSKVLSRDEHEEDCSRSLRIWSKAVNVSLALCMYA